MSKLKSKIWSHFTPINGEKKVQCLYCDRELSVANKSTCSLIRHINKKHPTPDVVWQADPESNDNVPIGIQSTSTGVASPRKRAKVKNIANKINAKKKFISPPKKEILINNKGIHSKKQDEIDRQLVKMITKDYHPFSIVEDKEFVKLINLLNPSYKLPTSKTVYSTLIPVMFSETVEKVKIRLKRATTVCLTTDGWTSKSGEMFYALTAHYIVESNEGIALESDLLGCLSFTECHTAENIANKMKDILDEWELFNKVVVIVSVNDGNMEAAVRLAEWPHWGCFGHSLNSITRAGMNEIESVIEKIRTVVGYFKRNSLATLQLEVTQGNMNQENVKLKIDFPNRWNSTFDMIKRIVSIKNAVVSTFAVLKSSLLVRNEEIQEVDVLTNDDWLIAEEAVQVLEVFDTLTTVISSQNKVTMSSIIIYLKQLSIHLNKFKSNECSLTAEINNMVTRLLAEIDMRFFSESDNIEDNVLVGLSTILDPRYKKFGFINEVKYAKMLEKLYGEVANDVVLSEQNMASYTNKVDDLDDMFFNNFDNEVQKYTRPQNAKASAVVEVDKYLQEPLLPRKDDNGVNTDPLLWWFQRKHIYPRLYQLVKSRLCIIATSVPCERIFTHSGQVVDEKRRNIKANEVANMVFLNYNLNDT